MKQQQQFKKDWLFTKWNCFKRCYNQNVDRNANWNFRLKYQLLLKIKNVTSINIRDDSFIPVINSKHKQNYDQSKKTEGKTRKKSFQNMQIKNFQILIRLLIRQHIEIGIFQKRNNCLSETYIVIRLRRIYINSLV